MPQVNLTYLEPSFSDRFSITFDTKSPMHGTEDFVLKISPIEYILPVNADGYPTGEGAWWSRITITFGSFIDPSIEQKLIKAIEAKTISFHVDVLDPVSISVKRWSIIDAVISRVNFGALDAESSVQIMPSLEVVPTMVALLY